MILHTNGLEPSDGVRCNVVGTDAVTTLATVGECALVYLDPPFGSGKSFHFGLGGGRDGAVAYEDPPFGPEASLRDAAALARSASAAVTDRGVVVVQVDANRSAHFRVAFDEVLGPQSFRGELIVRSGSRDARPRPDRHGGLTPTHNSLLLFSRARLPSSPLPLYRSEHCQGERPLVGVGFIDTLWCDLEVRGRETGYPTEKSRDFAERLVTWLTREGDHVVEPFGGSATLSCLALDHGCRVTVGDLSARARGIAASRLLPVVLDGALAGRFDLDVEVAGPTARTDEEVRLVLDLDKATGRVGRSVQADMSAPSGTSPRLAIYHDGRCAVEARTR